jgi:large subunit ribosomal protein L6
MSRIGRKPIPVPAGVTIEVAAGTFTASGPKGKVSQRLANGIEVVSGDGQVEVRRSSDERQERARHGLMRALLANAVQGVSQGFVKNREVHLALGYSHPVVYPIPEGIDISMERNTRITVSGADRQKVGQVAAEIRGLRPPDPYKGKGIRYADEQLRLKVGKAGAK